MKKKEKLSEKIKRVKGSSLRNKMVKDVCEEIAWRFIEATHECRLDGRAPLSVVEKISPWEHLVGDDDDSDKKWDDLYNAMKISFSFGYVLGQLFDIPDIDITPIKELLKKENVCLYMPHEKKAA